MWCASVCMLSHFSCVQLLVTRWAIAHQAPLSILFSRQKYCHAFLQGIFRIQGSSLHLFQLLLCRWILYHWVTKKEEGNDNPFLPGKSHGRRSLVGCSPWGCEQLDTTEQLHFHFSLSCIGEGNGNPPQCSCLENCRDGGAWWAAVYRVAQSWTRLKQLSNSSSNSTKETLFLVW